MGFPGMLIVPCACLDWLPAGLLADRPPRLEWDFRLLINSLIIAAVLLVGAFVIAVINRWRRSTDRTLTPSDQLTHFRSLYEEGTISKEEFDRLRSLLGRRIKDTVEAPPPMETGAAETRTIAETTARPSDPMNPQNPSGSSDPPETGIRPA